MLWKLESDEDFFRIYDSKKLVAGYLDPDYGNDVFSKKNSEELIESMQKNHDPILRGMMMIPMVKFRLFDTDLNTSLLNVEQNVIRVSEHLKKWKKFLSEINYPAHSIRISHTDQDMLTISFPIQFSKPTPLKKEELVKEISPTLDLLQKFDLL